MEDKITIFYEEYYGIIKFSEEDQLYHSKIEGIKDSFTCEGETIKVLMKAFIESVKDYLSICKELGKEPEKPKFFENLEV